VQYLVIFQEADRQLARRLDTLISDIVREEYPSAFPSSSLNST